MKSHIRDGGTICLFFTSASLTVLGSLSHLTPGITSEEWAVETLPAMVGSIPQSSWQRRLLLAWCPQIQLLVSPAPSRTGEVISGLLALNHTSPFSFLILVVSVSSRRNATNPARALNYPENKLLTGSFPGFAPFLWEPPLVCGGPPAVLAPVISKPLHTHMWYIQYCDACGVVGMLFWKSNVVTVYLICTLAFSIENVHSRTFNED